MQKILLTSTGFGNKSFESLFHRQITKPAEKARVIFVPTAANYDERSIYSSSVVIND